MSRQRFKMRNEVSYIEEELIGLGIDAEVNYQQEWREGPNVVSYESIMIMFKDQQDLNFYKTVGEYKEDGENIIFDCPIGK